MRMRDDGTPKCTQVAWKRNIAPIIEWIMDRGFWILFWSRIGRRRGIFRPGEHVL